MNSYTIGFALAIPSILAAGSASSVSAWDCERCEEYAYEDEHGHMHYWHRFNPEGGYMRDCEGAQKDGGCDSCHSNWVEEAACDVHDTCSKFALSVTEKEVQDLISIQDGLDRGASVVALAKHVSQDPNLSYEEGRGVLSLTDCTGAVLREWEVDIDQ
jgi:hypothetical protein